MSDAAPAGLFGFSLDELAPYTRDKGFPRDAAADFRLFYVGVDDVHQILDHLLARCRQSLVMNMFGYDDDALNQRIMALLEHPDVLVKVTLDKSQAGGVHEKRILDADRKQNLALFNSHFAIGQSATHSISHTKGGVIDGLVGWEGSTNWSADGEGTFVVKGEPGGPRYKAQNNTLMVYTNPAELRRARDRLDAEHAIAAAQMAKAGSSR